MDRSAVTQPWGFSIEGGRNSEFFHNDPSIVVTGIAENTPAYNVLKWVSVWGIEITQDFNMPATKAKTAAVLLINTQVNSSDKVYNN